VDRLWTFSPLSWRIGGQTFILPYVLVFGVSFLVVLLVTPLCRGLALSLGVVDLPGPRKIHERPVAYLGGLAFYTAFLAASVLTLYLFPSLLTDFWLPERRFLGQPFVGLAIGALLVVLVGIVDDVRGIRARYKLLFHLFLGVLLYCHGSRIERFTFPFMQDPLVLPVSLAVFATAFWVAAVINAVNLIDGMDGLAAGVSSISALTLFALYYSADTFSFVCLGAMVLAGATLAFLRYNFHPASIFMGDTGSMLLGFLFAAITIFNPGGGSYTVQRAPTLLSFFVPAVALAMAIIEVSTTFVRRVRSRQNLGKADREHIHHRLLHLGFTQRQTVMLIYCVSLFFGICAYLLKSIEPRFRVFIILLIALWSGLGIWMLTFLDRTRGGLHRKTPPEDPPSVSGSS
jgi:UDP-GlcNAc:undecaprenyl-phosphate GlcNAc-1-phosphate transferase